MLLEWRLRNFKSVTQETALPLAPLTIFTGANSAGKSTILQSILLTSQTVQSPVFGKPVILNGNMARLGSYGDIASAGDEESEIHIGFDLNMQSNDGLSSNFRQPRNFFYRRGIHFRTVTVDYAFTAKPGPNDHAELDLLRLQPLLTESSVTVRYREDESHQGGGTPAESSVAIRRSNIRIDKRAKDLKLEEASLDHALLNSLQYEIVRAPRNSRFYEIDGLKVRPELAGAIAHHFLPRQVTGRYDYIDAEVKWKLSLLIEPRRNAHYYAKFSDSTVSNSAATLIASLLQDTIKQNEELGRSGLSELGKRTLTDTLEKFKKSRDLREMQALYTRLPSRDVSFIFTLLGNERATLEKEIRGGRGAAFVLENAEPSDPLDLAMDYVHYFFMRSIKYLGPLRDEPKPVYPLVGSSDPADVGLRGEHTAAVLHVHKNTIITYIPSASFASNEGQGAAQNQESAVKQSHLASAVQDWLSYMGVSKDFSTNDLGKLGHELKVISDESGLKHDLTQVGVGVSQVLPILVLALLADSGTTLVFEQPELHLHPRVQSRLADFFVSMTILGKQCLVETHSEYLINRLRYRAAVDATNRVADSAMIYFVQKQGIQSDYKKIKLDALGSLDSWPMGFFDESELATSRLLKASLNKRRNFKK